MSDSNMTFDDLGVGMPPSVPNYRAGLLISKADAPRLIRDHIKREDIHKYVGKLVAKDHPQFRAIDNVIYNKDGTNLVYIPTGIQTDS